MFSDPSCPYLIDEASAVFGGLGGRPRSKRQHLLPLDPVDPNVALCLRPAQLASLISEYVDQWVGTFRKCFFAQTANDWCGWSGAGLGLWIPTDPKYIPHLMELENLLIAPLTGLNQDKRITLPYFEVAKMTAPLARAIINCKALNEHMGKSPKVLFPSIEDIFAMLLFFPQAHTVTADFRHWFHQLPLPVAAHFLFTVASGSTWCGEYLAWPMGFNWSPFVSQTISMLLVRLAVEKLNWTAESPIPACESTPPFWIIRNQTNRVIAFAVVWYDNLLIIATNAAVQEKLSSAFLQICGAVNAKLKPFSKENPAVFQKRIDSMDYIGIHFSKAQGRLYWQHMEKPHWLAAQEAPLTWRSASCILGIIVWDWTVSGDNRSSIRLFLRISKVIGLEFGDDKHQNSWDDLAPVSKISADDWELLQSKLKDIQNQGIQERFLYMPDAQPRKQILLASDAMKNNGAVVFFDASGKEIDITVKKYSAELSINFKETDIARTGVVKYATRFPGSEIRLCVDNTTALVAMKRRIFSADEEQQEKLDEMTNLLQNTNTVLLVCQVAGLHMAADERSRGLVSSREKMILCAKFLEEIRTTHWFLNLRKNQEK